MTPIELVFMRHGEAHCQIDKRVGGPRGCTGLTGRGVLQAKHAARWLAAEHERAPFTTVYASPLPRARETADLVAQQLRLRVDVRSDLRDPDYGEADGLLWKDVLTGVRGQAEDGLTVPIAPDAEIWTDYLARVGAELDWIVTRHPHQRVLVIGHGETISAAGYSFFSLPPSIRVRAGFATDATGITRWARRRQEPASELRWVWTLVEHNRTSHLYRMRQETSSDTASP